MRVETMELCVTACEKFAFNNEVSQFLCACVMKRLLWDKCAPQVTQVGLGFVFPSSSESGRFTHWQSGHLDCSTSLHAFILLVRSIFRVLPRWSRSPWIRSLAVRGMWWSVRALGLRWPTKSGTCSTCSSVEVWLCVFGNAPDVTSCDIFKLMDPFYLCNTIWLDVCVWVCMCTSVWNCEWWEKYRLRCTSPDHLSLS